jgi:hypothetical protein
MIKKLEDKIIKVLESYPQAKDSDPYLVTVLWIQQLRNQGIDPKEITAWEFLGMLGRKELLNTDSISRCRQKVQENHVALRGKNYEKRQTHSNKVKDEIKNWTGELF